MGCCGKTAILRKLCLADYRTPQRPAGVACHTKNGHEERKEDKGAQGIRQKKQPAAQHKPEDVSK